MSVEDKKDDNHNVFSRRRALGKIIASAAAIGSASCLARASTTSETTPATLPPAGVNPAQINGAPGIILDHATTSWAMGQKNLRKAKVNSPEDNYAFMQQLVEDKKYLTVDSPIHLNKRVKLNIKDQIIDGRGNGMISALHNMQNDFLFELTADGTRIHEMILDNPLMLKSASGGRQGGIMISANFCEVSNCYFYRMLQSVISPASFAAYGTKIVNNWFLECLGAGDGMKDLSSKRGEDRGDAVTIWGSGTIMTGNHAFCKEGEDARLAFHAEGLPGARKITRDFDHKDIIMANNMAKGSFRRHFAMENINGGVSIGNVSMGGATWWGEAYIQCKNINVKNTIRYINNPKVVNGKAWNPIKAAIAVVNFNEGINIDSNVIIGENTRGYGFAIATQTGEHHVTLSGSMINEGLTDNTALFLNQPKTFRIMNLETRGFKRAALITSNPGVTISSSNCYHQLNGSGIGLEIARARGGNISINGDTYTGVTTAFKLPNLDYLSITNNQVNGSERFAALSGIKKALVISNNVVTTDKNMDLLYVGGPSPDIAFTIENNIGVSTDLTYSQQQLASASSILNQRNKFAGKNISVSNNEVYVALGHRPDSPWLNLASQKQVKPS